MDKMKVDLLREKYQLEPPRRAPFLFFGKLLLVIAIVTGTAGAALSYQVTSSGEGGFPGLSLFSAVRHLVGANDRMLKGENSDRVNFLLMGIGGEGHDGPQLTDTMLFASYKPSTAEVGLISIPRDMAVPIPGYGLSKVNHANAYGEMTEPGAGPLLATQVVSDVLDQEIPYYVRVDFSGFAKLIDDVGGIDVYVAKSFTDSEYPILGSEYAECGTYVEQEEVNEETGETEIVQVPTYDCRYETISYKEGWMHMDGETALKFVRSRHGTNGEGSDFARSRRQQSVILAVKEKVFSAGTVLNPARIGRILETLDKNLATNLSTWELLRLAEALKDFDQSKMKTEVLDSSETSPLYATSLKGVGYVLLPRNDDWGAVQRMAANIFSEGTSPTIADAKQPEKPSFVKVEIQNGTSVNGLAFRTSQLLDQQGYEVIKIGNAEDRAYKHTVIYDLTNGSRPQELKALQDYLQADVMLSATGWLVSDEVVPHELALSPEESAPTTEEGVDFLVILGEGSANLVLN